MANHVAKANRRAGSNGKIPKTRQPPVTETVAEVGGIADAPLEPNQYPGVLVLRVPGEQPGQEQIQIMPLNGMDALAVPILLECAIRIHKQQLGLTEGR